MNVTPRHAKRFASALQKYADCYEHIGEHFVVLSDDVIESLNAQKIFKLDQDMIVQARRPGDHLPCPHVGLRVNLCTPAEDLRFMQYVYTDAPEIVAHKLSFTWTIGRTTFLRGQSIRNLLYYDLFTSDVFGPEPKHHSNKHCLMIILRKGIFLLLYFIIIYYCVLSFIYIF